MTTTSLRISGKAYQELKDHLYPGDGKEAVAIALCGRHMHKKHNLLLVHKLINIPYNQCDIREPNLLKWSTSILIPHLNEAVKREWALVKIHSHPTGHPTFSKTDDKSDIELFDSVYGWMDNQKIHASMLMLPTGVLFGRVIKPDLSFEPLRRISVAGDDLLIWDHENEHISIQGYSQRTSQTLGKGTTNLLKKLKIGIIGCSGTGSPTIEQLVRLGVGSLLIADPDKIEERNLNRILNSTMLDALNGRYKVDVLKRAISRFGLGTEVIAFKENIYNNIKIIDILAQCDIIFGCVDSIDGRHLLNQISTFYLVPYFDLGVKILADGNGGIDQICGTVHYVQPGGSSLRTRGVYNSEELRSASMFRANRKEYEEQLRSGYIFNANVESPAVISINMQTSSMAVNEFLARIHPYRYDLNSEYSITRFSLTDGYIQKEGDGLVDEYLARYTGRGDCNPKLNMPEL
jgi:hypothetical protein